MQPEGICKSTRDSSFSWKDAEKSDAICTDPSANTIDSIFLSFKIENKAFKSKETKPDNSNALNIVIRQCYQCFEFVASL